MAKRYSTGECGCGNQGECQCQWCTHSKWTDWFGSKHDPLSESHYCRGCGKEESRDIRNGY